MKGFGHFLGVVFFGLHMWFQVVYLALFIAVSAVTGSIGSNWDIFLMGLGPTFLVSLILTYRDKVHAQEMKDAIGGRQEEKTEPDKKSQRENVTSDNEYDNSYLREAEEEARRAVSSQTAPAQFPSFAESAGGGYDSAYARNFMDRPYYAPHQKLADNSSYMENMQSAETGANFRGYYPPQSMAAITERTKATENKPAIYRLKDYPDIVVYDYPTKTQYFRVDENGNLSIIKVVPKDEPKW